MGGNPGSQVEVTISGENIDPGDELAFTDPRITAKCRVDAEGKPVPNQYVISIAADCAPGLYEARALTRLGMSSSRIFSVGTLPEVRPTKPNTSLVTAMDLSVNSLCNAATTSRSVDFYRFNGHKDQRIIVDCSARGIDSKLEPVLIIANAAGNDLIAERRGGILDYTLPADGGYVIKVHDLTFNGGPAHFYRMAVYEASANAPITRMPSTKAVNSTSWPPAGLPVQAALAEVEPNNDARRAQKISLPCDISGSFFPAADVDVFEFEAKKGEVWWVEVGSERLGLPTDPAAVVQRVDRVGNEEKLVDIVEFSDIPSPVKVSSNGYTYDGPVYNIGSFDFMGKLAIEQDGLYRLELSDLFGGTRNDPRNAYRLIIRKATPEFALAAWAIHFELRNGDRNAVSKPMALRGGLTVALEVLAIRRDGFDGDIELEMSGLPEGVSAKGLKIPAGKSRGVMLVTAAADTPRAFCSAQFFGRAQVDGKEIVRPCHWASMAWPVVDSWGEIPSPRLMMDVPISVSGHENAPITLAPKSKEIHEVVQGEKLTIPLVETRRSDFSGENITLKTMGAGFEGNAPFDVSLKADTAEAVIDLAKLKTPPGDYTISFYGSAVAKYRHRMFEVASVQTELQRVESDVKSSDVEVSKLTEAAKSAAAEQKADADKALEAAIAKQKANQALLAVVSARMKKASDTAQPNDLVDIVVSEPISIRVKPMEKQ